MSIQRSSVAPGLAGESPRQGAPVSRRAVLTGLAALVAAPSLPASAAAAVGTVEELKGEASVRAGGAERKLEKAAAVQVGDQIGTGPNARLTLRLGEQTRLRLGERANATIDRFEGDTGEITLKDGAAHFERSPRSRSPFRIVTPHGVVMVRGTRFFVGPSGKMYGVFVERGRVTVTSRGKTVTLRRGQGTDLNAGFPPTRPKRWGQERIRTALESIR
jgi:ferric-dicitrate binding protein FerR (iron transport regulator)